MWRDRSQQHGTAWICVRALVLAAFILTSGLTLMVMSRNVRAMTVIDYYDRDGYAGPEAIYLTTKISSNDNPRIISPVGRVAMSTGCSGASGTDNIVALGAGEHNPQLPGTAFQEYYESATGLMVIKIPMAADGASDVSTMVTTTHTKPPRSLTTTATVLRQEFVVVLRNSPGPGSEVKFDTGKNSGVNVEGPGWPGQKDVDLVLATIMMDTVGMLGGWQVGAVILANDVASGVMDKPYSVTAGTPDKRGVSTANEIFLVKGFSTLAGDSTNAFASLVYVEVDIPYSMFTAYAPKIDITARNYPGSFTNEGAGVVCIGATAPLTLSAYPAVPIVGKAEVPSGPLVNTDVLVQSWDPTGTYQYNYHIKTDSSGNYRFFGALNTFYSVTVPYTSSFGPAMWSSSKTTASTPDQEARMDFKIPYISGTVKTATGAAIAGATVAVLSPLGQRATTTTGSSGTYSFIVAGIGEYDLTASAPHYLAGTAKASPTLNYPSTGVDITLERIPPDFTLANCGGWGTFTGSSGWCTVTATSVEGFSGTISTTSVLSPKVAGGAYITSGSSAQVSVSPTVPGSFTVYFNTGSVARTYTVTVTGTYGSLTHTTSFNVIVSNPPPPPSCPPVCPT